MVPRFYCPTLETDGLATLPEAEAHHLTHVLRLAPGDAVEVFNGRGLVGRGVVQKAGKREATCAVREVVVQPQPSPSLILATAVPKGERFDWLVEKATELGVARLIPLRTARGAVDPRESKLDRLRLTVVAACKQSRRAHLMELTSPQTWSDFLTHVGERPLVVADPRGVAWSETLSGNGDRSSTEDAWVACVGPEGGFTDDEIALAVQFGARLVSLGSLLLRIETAGVALAAWGLLRRTSVHGRHGL